MAQPFCVIPIIGGSRPEHFDPLYEVVDGVYTLNFDPDPLASLAEYMKPQGRFRHLTPDEIARIEERVRADYALLKRKVAMTHAEAGR